MRKANSTWRARSNAVLSGLGLALFCASGSAIAADGPLLADRYTATTTAMTPRDVTLRIDVRTWSDDGQRGAVVEALSAASEADAAAAVAKALQDLPTVGYIWQSNSPVGYAVKYAHRAATPDGERLTFVTDKRIGAYELKPWALDPPLAPKQSAYSVIELYLDGAGQGDGTLSLAAEPKVDTEQSLVTLATDAATPRVLANAKRVPKGYGATSG